MNADSIRCRMDTEIYQRLLTHPDVERVNKHIAKREEKGPQGVRRHLLATSVRLSKGMAPDIHNTTEQCIDTLGVKLPVELYVFASPQFNAACVKPEEGRLFIMFSSSLLEGFNDRELRFVIGHELGHHLYKHHDIPIGYILRGKSRPSPRLALDLSSWSRYAETSADRAGAFCARDMEAVACSLFKLASGLSGTAVRFCLDDFLIQVDDMQIEDAEPGQGAPKEDWFLTHPFSPLRVKALKLFDQSELMRDAGISTDDMEAGVQGLMSLMEPSYLEGRTDTAEAMRRLLFAGLVVVAEADGEISDEEIEIFEKFFGDKSFHDRLSVEKIKNSLPERIEQTKATTSLPQRMQVLRDICSIARADGHGREAEIEAARAIAKPLEIPEFFINQVFETEPELD